MAFSLFSVVSLTVIYRLTINFPELPYTQELKNVESEEFLSNSRHIAHEIQHLVKDLEGRHTARVVDYKYHKIIGSLVYVDLYAEKESPRVSDVLLSAIKSGRIGNLTVSDEGFELHVVRDSSTACAATEFTCLDKTCIPADQRCDGRRDCPDGSDEHKEHGKCKQHQPIIHQTEKVVFAQKHGSIHLSATIDSSVEDKQIAWSKDSILLGVGSMTLAEDGRVTVYKKGDKHHLHIINATDSDDGTYKMIIQGMNVEADFEVRITSDRVAIESDECPSGERACKSGHCLPVAQFCDRRVQCPDGDDEENCSEVQCKSNEFRCESTNVCVPTVVVCDGWKDCHDGSDEKTCSHPRKIYKPHHPHHVKVNALCQDGTEPEFSLHGSSYCWSNKVCPSLTECVHGLCCPISKTRKRQSDCLEGQFKCGSGQCIEESQKCNRKYDCADGSDETSCDYYLAVQKYHAEQERQGAAQPSAAPTHAPSHHQQPQPQAPISAEEQSDNLVCNDQEFRCPYLPNTRCFHYDKLCDGVDDCGDGSDETNCDSNEDQDQPAAPIPPPVPAPDSVEEEVASRCSDRQFECKRDGKCIDRQLECNHKYDCEDGSDETECEYFKAAMARRGEYVATTTEQQRQHHQAQQQHQVAQGEHHHAHHAQQQHPAQPAQPAQPDQHEEHRRRLEEHRRREDEHRRRQEEESRARAHQQSLLHASQVESTEVTFHDEYDSDSAVGCLEHEFQCAIGECIDKRRVCDTRPDCLDASDEQNCSDRAPPPQEPAHHQQHHVAQPAPPSLPSPAVNNYPDQDIDSDDETSDVQITVFPSEKEVRDGRDVSFECRARTSDNSVYPTVRWARVGGPLPSSAHDSGGRLTINPVSLSDAGTYICVSDYNGQTVEARATLNVVSYGPQEVSNGLRAAGQCMADEKACGNNECVKNDYVCDGEPDCRDRSDEANCPSISRTCEPNEFKCNNNKCVQKMWLCDGDDDCGDNSDELNCNAKPSDNGCKPTEFQCHDRRQCVPSSFHCDGTNDCHDGSDEVGCVQPTVVDPPQTNLQVPRGNTFSLTCKAVAVPEPYINWRLNWGPVCEPPRCLQTSEGGYGTLTIHDAQPVDQGAYTCEAINVKGRVLATPDCIVRVVDEAPRPQPPPTAPPQRATCDTRGAVSPYPNNYGSCDCKSQVTGPNCDQCKPGAFHLSEKSPEGCLKCFCFGVSNDCRSSGYYRTKDAACDRLMFAGDAEGVTMSDIEERAIDRNSQFSFFKTGYLTFDGTTDGITKYWRLPQRFLGDKVTAYGGKMEFEIEFSGSGHHSTEPMVVLKGNQNILVHRVRNQEQVLRSDSPVRITVETYETNYEQLNGAAATREDLLMVLADLDAFLIRATHVAHQSSTSLGDVSWEIAVDRYTPDGLALEVEQCVCPPGYLGTSCEDCAPGYERSGHGPYLGTCVPIQPRHQQCGPGALAPTAPAQGQCQCKASVIGPNCDRCAPNSFGLAPTNPQGCIPCFCSGVTQQCSASNYKRTSVSIDYSRGDRDQLELTTSDSRQPFSPQTRAHVSGQAIEFRSFEEARGQTLYWKLPEKFLGDKVTSYGGVFKYTFKFSGSGATDQSADVILRGNDIALQYKHREPFHPDRENNVEIKIFETSWQRVDGQQATREHLLMTLADLDTILIKSTYNNDCTDSQLISVNFEYAEPYGQGLTAAEVEQCICPPGYVGTSCEDCAPGYSRTGGGLYLGLCEKCECNGHASQCDKEYGYCLDCQHNTEGDQCERCKPGFVGDARRGTPNDCQPEATRAPCHCNNHSPRGCDSFGRCLLCEHNTEGTHCERCKKGYYGDATKGSPYDCTPCPCPGASDCYLDNEGQVACRICPAGLQGRLCNECAPGYTRSNKPAGRVCEPIGQVTNEDITFVQKPHEGGRPPQPVIDPPHLVVNEGEPAAFRCWVPGIPDCQITWHRDQLGGPLPHGVYQTGNALKIPQSQLHHAGRYICSAANQYGIGQSPPAVLEVKRPVTPPKVDPVRQTVDRDQPARFMCWVPGNSNVQLRWSRPGGGPLPSGVQEQQGILHIPRAGDQEVGQYVCTATDPANNTPLQSEPVQLNIRDPAPPQRGAAPQIDPPNQTVNVNDPAQFRCWVPGQPRAQLKWSRKDGRPLPNGILERDGFLRIDKSQLNDAGEYECTATEPDGSTQFSPPARLNVNQPQAIQPQVDPPVQTVNEGEPSRIRCWVPGHPNIQLQFVKRGRRPLPVHARVSVGNLEIPRTLKSDEDEYICIATDPNTNRPVESNPARVIVKSPIRPIIDPAEQTVPEGSPFRIRCYVPGHPSVQLSFRRASGQLNEDADENNGLLAVQRAELTDEGDYICTARDPDTGAPIDSSPATVHVTNAAGPPVVDAHQEPPTAVVEPRTWNGKPGERHQFRCITTGSPTPKITWTGPDGSPLPHDVTPLEPNILDFSNGRSELNGEYTCTASNPIGEATDHGVVNIGPSLTVKTNPAGPKLIVTVGEPLQVKCEAFGAPGDPEPEVEWLHDPGPERGDLPDDFKPVTISEQFIRHPNVGLGNAGVYTCKGSSAHATATKNIYIEVVEPSRIATVSILGGSSQWFDQGEKGELICTATGSSLVDRLEWEKVDDQLPTDVEEHNEPGLLHFPSFKNSYAGEYRCNGYRNNEIIASAGVHVHSSSDADDEPKVEIEPPRVRVVSQGDNIVLKCSVQGAENGEHFKWALLRGGSLVRQLGTEPTLEITKADPSNDFGVYRCNVEDNNGLVIGSAYTAVSVGQQDKSHAQIVKFDDKSDASFTCPIYSVPGSKVEWTYENGDLPSKAVPNGNKIEIKEFDDASAGTYVCRVSFDGNVVEGFVTAQMFVPDTIIQVLLEVSSESPQIGDRAWFDCKVTGDPSAVIQWAKEGNDDLPPNSQVTGGRLLFTDLKEENAGVYRCVAKTKAGPLQTRTVLNVGSGKRKRKHLGNRRGRRLRHRRRNVQNPAAPRKTRTTTKLFGSWF